jgi:hypothetical protein
MDISHLSSTGTTVVKWQRQMRDMRQRSAARQYGRSGGLRNRKRQYMIGRTGVLMRLEKADEWCACIRVPRMAMRAIALEKRLSCVKTDFHRIVASMG